MLFLRSAITALARNASEPRSTKPVVHGWPFARYGRGAFGSRRRSRNTAMNDSVYAATKKKAAIAIIVSNVPVARKASETRPDATSDVTGVPPEFTRVIMDSPSPSRLTEYITRDAISRHAFTALGSDAITTTRTSDSPTGPNRAFATVPAASGDPASARVGSAVMKAALISR